MIKLTRKEKLGFGAGDAAVNISMMSMSLILTFFYTDIFGLDPSHMAFLFLIVRCIDAVTDPVMGWMTDRVKWASGRYRAWIGLGAVPFGLSVYLVFANPDLAPSQRIVWAYATYIFNTIMFTIVTIPYISLIGVITDSPMEKLSANTYRFVLAKGAVLIVTTSLVALAEWLGGGDKARGFGGAMAIMGLASTILLLICYRHTEERVEPSRPTHSLWEQLGHLVRNDQWRILALACVLMMTGYLVRGSIAFHYATYYLGISGGAPFAVFMAMWALGGITATLVASALTRVFCKVRVMQFSMFAAAIIAICMFLFVGERQWVAGIVFYFLLCMASDVITPIFWASISEVVDYGEAETGARVMGLVFGSISFLQKFGMGIAGFIVGLLLGYFEYTPGTDQSEFTLQGISLMMSIIPGAIFLATGLVLLRFRISNAYYEEHLANPGIRARES